MFPMSMHTAQPVVADRRSQTEAAASRHRLARSLAGTGAARRGHRDAPGPRRGPGSRSAGSAARFAGSGAVRWRDALSPGENALGGDEGLESFLCRSGRAARPTARGGGPRGCGESSAVVVGGEAGVGKTRLVRQVADEVARPVAGEGAGVRVLSGTCIDLGEGGPPFGPMVEILRTLVREDGATAVRTYAGPAAGELGRLVSELASPEPAGVPEPVIGAIDPAGGATRLFEVFLGLFERLARDRPVLVLVEDLHWADRSTRDLLTYLIHRLGPARVADRHDVPQ